MAVITSSLAEGCPSACRPDFADGPFGTTSTTSTPDFSLRPSWPAVVAVSVWPLIPSHGCSMAIPFSSDGSIDSARLMGIAKPTPTLPSTGLWIESLMPINWPWPSSSAPPELPGLMGASVAEGDLDLRGCGYHVSIRQDVPLLVDHDPGALRLTEGAGAATRNGCGDHDHAGGGLLVDRGIRPWGRSRRGNTGANRRRTGCRLVLTGQRRTDRAAADAAGDQPGGEHGHGHAARRTVGKGGSRLG